MKFAVVEYTSKSGTIWRHTDAKPNYVADPDKEIDATSFGCYVSALKGEHIPLKSFIVGRDSGANKLSITIRKVVKRLFGNFPQTYDISYFNQFDALLVVHQISDTKEMINFIKRLSKQKNRPILVGVPTQPWGILTASWDKNPKIKEEVQEFIHACDAFVTVVKSTQEDWQKLTDRPVTYLPQPYPVHYATKYYQGRDAKKPIIFVAGVTDRPDIARGHKVARELQKRLPQYEIHITDTPGMTQDISNLEGAKYSVQKFLPWQDQLKYLSEVALVVNTDYTQTRGRVQVDCAAVGTPSIGADSDGQVDLYPDLPGTITTSVETFIEQGIKLLTNDAYYTQVTQTATERLAGYTYEICVDRLQEIINNAR